MTKQTIITLLQAEPALGQLTQTTVPNAKASYRIAVAARKISQALKDFYETRAKFADELGVVGDNGQADPTAENWSEFESKIAALTDETVELDIHTVPIEWMEGVDLAPTTFMALPFLFEDSDA